MTEKIEKIVTLLLQMNAGENVEVADVLEVMVEAGLITDARIDEMIEERCGS